jgi:hypothetical protein
MTGGEGEQTTKEVNRQDAKNAKTCKVWKKKVGKTRLV